MHILMNHSEAGLFLCMQNLGYIKNGIKTVHTNTHKKKRHYSLGEQQQNGEKKSKTMPRPGIEPGTFRSSV